MLKIISIGIASIIFIASIFLCGAVNGFQPGGNAAFFNDGGERFEIVVCNLGLHIYSVIMLKYALIAALMYLYMIGKLQKKAIISRLLSVTTLVAAIVTYWQMIDYKTSVVLVDGLTYGGLMLMSLKFDLDFFSCRNKLVYA